MTNYQYMLGQDTTVSGGGSAVDETTAMFLGTENDLSLTNLSNQIVSDAGVWMPFLWQAYVDTRTERVESWPLPWNNTLHGFYTSNFNNTGESLLITPQLSAPGSEIRPLQPSQVADGSGTHDYPRTISTSFPGDNGVIQSKDLLPFADLGSLSPGQTKSFSLTLTYHWGGADLGQPGPLGGILVPLEADRTSANHVG